MPKKLGFILPLVGLALFACSGETSSPSGEGTVGSLPSDDISSTCKEAVNEIFVLHSDLGWPEHLMQENAVKTDDDFDVKAYFDVLDHLTVRDGYVLDYVYLYDFMGGYPVLYALPVDDDPFQTFQDYAAATGGSSTSYLHFIETDDTPEGYLQLVVLEFMGSQFYLWWHAGYNDYQIVCDDHALEVILTSLDEFGGDISDDVREQARAMDLTPVVEYDGDVVRVQVINITKWGGFYRMTFTMQHDSPGKDMESEWESLVPYDCGIMF